MNPNGRLFLMPAGNASDCEERGHDWLTWNTEPPTVACSHCGLRRVDLLRDNEGELVRGVLAGIDRSNP